MNSSLQLETTVKEEWDNIHRLDIQNLIWRINRRLLQAVVQAREDNTRYWKLFLTFHQSHQQGYIRVKINRQEKI